ncbi:hypothetical protein PCYB_072030 [Plasmodium cynomolgi strain B]|uniref:Uncharacterized protein n=1 Tax=Plasmodium cynomolgi (strain B) TaxID=1120755 RepID=K6UCZ3_PLACD|nr:hypothetical protein PCYB_072030 [Plasmodium cynomolgi strain B]GAB65701.1 hypothetical protein PCYB_072030 [Plasmodium cynomolgi strain B]
MTTIRWMHRKGQNCEKRVISLNEIKERYLNDAANQRKDKRNENNCRDEVNACTEKKKGGKKLITFYEKKAEKNVNQQKGLSEKGVSKSVSKNVSKSVSKNVSKSVSKNVSKSVSVYFGGKKKYCCSGENGETKNGYSECGGEVTPLADQHSMFGRDSDLEKGGIDRPMEEKSSLCPPHHPQQQVNINLDLNIQWDKQKGKFEKDNCDVGDKGTWQAIQGKTRGKDIQVYISDMHYGENSNWSESPVGYEQGRSRKGEVPPSWEREKYDEQLRYGNPREGHYYHEHSGGEYFHRSRSGGNPPHGEIPNSLDKNRHINRFAEECTTYDGTRPASYVPLEKRYGGHAWGNLHYKTEKEHSQFRYDSGGKLHSARKVERHGVETYEGGAQERVHPSVKQPHLCVKQPHLCVKQPHLCVKQPHLCVKQPHPYGQHLQQHAKNPLEDPLKTHPTKDRQKYAHEVDPKRICSDGKEKRKKYFQKRTSFFQKDGKRTDSDSGESSSDFSERGWIGQDNPKRGGRKEKKKALRQLALLKKEKREGYEDKHTHKHYSDHPIESNSTEERSAVKSVPHHVGPSHQDNTSHDHRVGEYTEEKNNPKLTSSKSHGKPCFGKPKIFRTDDFAIFFNKKILKEKDDVLQKCLLRSKSDAVLDFLKMTRMENFSKKATCSSAVVNFPDGVYYNDDMRCSTLLDRFFTATYSPDVRTVQHSTHRDKIHLSFYEHMTDNSTLIRSSVNYQQSHNKRETYMHFKRECFETGGVTNCVGSTSQSSTSGKELLTTNIADAVDAKMGSISKVMNKLGCLIGDSNFLSGVTPGEGVHIDDSSEEDVNDKRCRMFFKQFKKQLTMKYKEAAPGEDECGDDRHIGADHLCEADETQNGLSLSDLNSTVGVSKGGETCTHGGGCRNGNCDIAFIHP